MDTVVLAILLILEAMTTALKTFSRCQERFLMRFPSNYDVYFYCVLLVYRECCNLTETLRLQLCNKHLANGHATIF